MSFKSAFITIGGIWKKIFKGNRKGFAWRLKAELVEQWLKDHPNEEYISGLGFDNSEYKEQNDRAPDYTLVLVDNEEQSPRRGSRGYSSRESKQDDPKPRRDERRDEPKREEKDEKPSGNRRSSREESEVPF